jgi:amino acid transporter
VNSNESPAVGSARLKRTLGLWDLVLYGLVVVTITAPIPIFGVVSNVAHGHVATTILIGLIAMLFTGLSYGRMASAYPVAGSAFTYVGREIHPTLGYVTGWSMVMDYMINPIICIIWSAKAAQNIIPEVPYLVWAVALGLLFIGLNLRGVKSSARFNSFLAAGMGVVVLLIIGVFLRYLFHLPNALTAPDYLRPLYDQPNFSPALIFSGTSIAVLTYIGFDGISTLSEEVENPRKNILRATLLVCLITGILAILLVYLAQLVHPYNGPFSADTVETAYMFVAKEAGGKIVFHILNASLLVAVVGAGMGSMLGAARLLYGMGRDNAIPKSFFGYISPRTNIPRNNVLLVGGIALSIAILVNFDLFSYQLGAEMLNFGAFIAFMGVNAASVTRFWIRAEHKMANLIPQLLPGLAGFLICLYIWMSLSMKAKVAGGIWLACGLIYGAVKTKGFRKNLISFEVPAE